MTNGAWDARNPTCGDFDGDGHLDFITGVESAGADYLQLYTGDGLGNLSLDSIVGNSNVIGNWDVHGGWAYDYDEDGDLDLFVHRGAAEVYYFPTRVRVFSVMELKTQILTEAEIHGGGSVWDVDNDGDMDIVRGQWGGTPTYLRIMYRDASGFTQQQVQVVEAGANSHMECQTPNDNYIAITRQNLEKYESTSNTLPSILNNTDTHNHTAFLLMQVQNYTLGSWQTVATIHNSSIDIANSSDATNPLRLSSIWENSGSWNTAQNAGTEIYRVYLALTDNESNTLRNDNGKEIATFYNFSIATDTQSPVMSNFTISPAEDGYGRTFNVTITLIDQTAVDEAILTIDYMGTKTNYSMLVLDTIQYLNYNETVYQVLFNQSWYNGSYTAWVWTNDTIGYSNRSGNLTFDVLSDGYMFLNTSFSVYPEDATVQLAKKSVLNNTGTTDLSGYLLMQVFNESGTLFATTVNDTNSSTLRTAYAGNVLNLSTVWNTSTNGTGFFSNGYAKGRYYIIAALVDPQGNLLYTEDYQPFNTSAVFNITVDVLPPEINITFSPSITGFGKNVTATISITDNGQLDNISINLTRPDGVTVWPAYTNTSSIYTFLYNDTWWAGAFNLTVFANDSKSNTRVMNGSFHIHVNTSMSVSTFDDIYLHNEIVELTSPYTWWNTTWSYRIPLKVNTSSFNRTTRWVEERINLTATLATLTCGVNPCTGNIDTDSLRVIEHFENGTLLIQNISVSSDVKYEHPYLSWQESGFDQLTNAVYRIKWKVDGSIQAQKQRVYMVYFDIEKATNKPPRSYDLGLPTPLCSQ